LHSAKTTASLKKFNERDFIHTKQQSHPAEDACLASGKSQKTYLAFALLPASLG
jgi:hypothetical protein